MTSRPEGQQPGQPIRRSTKEVTDGQGGPAGSAARRAAGLSALDDVDAGVYTTGQAAELLGVPLPALRRLDDAGVLDPGRSSGGQRRYSRRQLHRAQRLLALVDEGMSIAAAGRITDLEHEVAALRDQLSADRLPGQYEPPGPAGAPE